MMRAINRSAITVLPVILLILLFSSLTRVSLVSLAGLAKGLAPLVLLGWLAYTVSRSKKPGMTFLGFCLVGLYSYYFLHHESNRGSEHAIVPILTGLIPIPIILQTLQDKRVRLPKQYFTLKPDPEDKALGILSTIVGMLSGLFAGIGASSLITFFESKAKDDEQYVYMSTCAETANSLFAVLLALSIGLGRSGEAVMLNRMLHEGNWQVVIPCTIIGMICGLKFTRAVAPNYTALMQKLPIKKIAITVGLLSLATIFLMPSKLTAIICVIIGCLISLWCRKQELPNQVVFASMAFPVLIYQADGVSFLNKILWL